MAKRWSKKAEQVLLQGIGVYGLDWFKKHCGNAHNWANSPTGRSNAAIYNKVFELIGEGGLTQGSYSINKMVKLTGYSRTQLKRAMRALAQKWKRLSPKGVYLVTEEQYLDIAQWLGFDYWSKKHRLYNCLWCNKTKFAHKAKGLCTRCYSKYIKNLERSNLPRENSELSVLVSRYVKDEVDKIKAQLARDRALPEAVLLILKDAKCLN